MARQISHNRLTHILLGGLVVALFLNPLLQTEATHMPANKPAAAGSSADVIGPGQAVTLLTTTLRSSAPTDLILAVTAECSIVTNVTTVGNDSQRAFGEVKLWIEIDGAAVPVASGDPDEGRVVFCNRAYQRTTSLFDDDDATIATFLKTRAANAFNWLSLNVGSGIHTITLKGTLTAEATERAVAEAVVGNRTLIIEPTMLSNDATI